MNIRLVKSFGLVAILCSLTLVIFAASGGKGKKKSSALNNSRISTSNKVSLGKISLRNNYEFKGGKLFSVPSKKDVTVINNYTSIQKGNKTIVVASKHTIAKPTLSLNTGKQIASVKIARISLN